MLDRGFYKQKLREVQQTLTKRILGRMRLDQEIAQLRQDMMSLAQLAGVDIKQDEATDFFTKHLLFNIGLTEACREVIRASSDWMTVSEVRDGIKRLGYDVNAHSNILASISVTLRRLVSNKEVESDKINGKKVYRLYRPNLQEAIAKGGRPFFPKKD